MLMANEYEEVKVSYLYYYTNIRLNVVDPLLCDQVRGN